MTFVSPARDRHAERASLWGWAAMLSPPLVLFAVVGISLGFHIFDGVPFTDQDLTPLQAFLVGCGMFLPVAAYFYAESECGLALALSSRTWPTAPGVVQSSRVVEKQVARWGTMYRLEIVYRYQVGGREYHGDRVAFGNSNVSEQDFIDGLAKKYRAGAEVPVHYNPADPENAVLETSEASARAYARYSRMRALSLASLPLIFWIVVAIRAAFDWHGWV